MRRFYSTRRAAARLPSKARIVKSFLTNRAVLSYLVQELHNLMMSEEVQNTLQGVLMSFLESEYPELADLVEEDEQASRWFVDVLWEAGEKLTKIATKMLRGLSL